MPRESFEKLPENKKLGILNTGIRAFSQKCYQEVGTDYITRECGISKGLLFHYFGSKKVYYLYCLEQALERLTEKTEDAAGRDFYEILFDSMNRKMALCLERREEMLLVNMASRDVSGEIVQEKAQVLGRYLALVHGESARTLQRAVSVLPLKEGCDPRKTAEGLHLYINAVLNRYLLQYQQEPEKFFENSEAIKREMKEYLDLMLYGICG